MPSFLLVYDTGEGQTRKVAERVAETLAADGHRTRTVDVAALPADLDVEDYDAVVVGGSIHLGEHGTALVEFVRANLGSLAARPGAFFTVCLSAASEDPERRAEADRYVEEFLSATGWAPDQTAVFAGALRYSEYGFLKRFAMKRIAKDATGDTDTSRDYEYTDWEAVESFTVTFADTVVAEESGIIVD